MCRKTEKKIIEIGEVEEEWKKCYKYDIKDLI